MWDTGLLLSAAGSQHAGPRRACRVTAKRPSAAIATHMQVIESEGEMVLEWATQLRNGARILRPEVRWQRSRALGGRD